EKRTHSINSLRSGCVQIGVTRVASITQFDRLGIPVFYCVRPQAATVACIVNSGKGLTDSEALAGTVFEALERAGAERTGFPCIIGRNTAFNHVEFPDLHCPEHSAWTT